MDDIVTLDSLFGNDPGTSDNSATQNGISGPTNPDPQASASTGEIDGEPSGQPTPTLEDRLAEIERREQRHIEQLNGSRQEAMTWKERAEQQEKLTNQLADHLQKLLSAAQVNGASSQPATPPVPTAFKASLASMLGYEPEDEHVQQMWSTLRPQEQARHENATTEQPAALTQADVQKMLEADRNKQLVQQQTLQALVQEHPEFAGNEWIRFYQEVLPTYQTLSQDPSMQVWLTPDPDGRFSYAVNGQTVDLRVMKQAAALYKQQQAQGKQTAQRNNQTTLGGNGRQAAPKQVPSIVLPRSVLDGLLNDTVIANTLARAGKGGSKREQAKWLWEKLPESRKKDLIAQYQAGNRGGVGSA